MSTDTTRLRDAVEQFADAPPSGREPSRLPPPELLRTLRRRQRRARAVPAFLPPLIAAAAVMALVIGSMAGLAAVLGEGGGRTPADVAGQGDAAALRGAMPMRIDVPGEWIDSEAAPGAAAAAMPWSHAEWLGGVTYDGVVTVSAETGAYTWIELPVAAVDEPAISLSPTGRFLAYWAGESRPQTERGQYLPGKATELRIRDLVTGEEVAHAPQGIPKGADASSEGLLWLDAERVGVSYGRIDAISPGSWSSTGRPPFVLDAVSGDVEDLAGDSLLAQALDYQGYPGAPLAVRRFGGDGEVIVLAPDGQVERRLNPGTLPGQGSLALSPDRTRFVGVLSDGAKPEPGTLLVTPATAAGEPEAETRRIALDGLEVYTFLGWRDDDHVIASAVQLRADGKPVRRGFPVGPPIVAIDVRDGSWEMISRAPTITGLDFADDLWAVPTVERAADASPPDPRLVLAGLAATGPLLAAGARSVLRQRRERRAR